MGGYSPLESENEGRVFKKMDLNLMWGGSPRGRTLRSSKNVVADNNTLR